MIVVIVVTHCTIFCFIIVNLITFLPIIVDIDVNVVIGTHTVCRLVGDVP